jgi:hypothetical protein
MLNESNKQTSNDNDSKQLQVFPTVNATIESTKLHSVSLHSDSIQPAGVHRKPERSEPEIKEHSKEQIASSDDLGLRIRALNPDNRLEAEQLVDLFREHYGNAHPFKKVYDRSFWLHSKQSKIEPGGLISLIAVHQGKFIAHIGIDKNTSTGAVQVLLPAIHPDYKPKLFHIVRSFWSTLERMAERQNWKMVFEYNLTVQPLLQMLSAKCYHSETTAILPCPAVSYGFGKVNLGEADLGTAVLVMSHVLQKPQKDEIKLYPPAAHAKKIKELYAAVDLPRTFNEAKRKVKFDSVSLHNSKEIKVRKNGAVKARSLRRFGLYQVRILPSHLVDFGEAVGVISKFEQQCLLLEQRLTLQIALDDPQCPQFCSSLEQMGFRFCGVLPMFADHDYIAYGRFDDDDIRRLTLYTDASKSLRSYMLQHTLAN